MTNKFNSFYLTLLVVLTGALILAPAVTASAETSEAPDYVQPGATDVLMLQFDVTNGGSGQQSFDTLSVSYTGSGSYADLDSVALLDSSEVEITSRLWDSASVTISSIGETLNAGETKTYHLAIDVALDATDGETLDVQVTSIGGGANVSTVTPTNFSSNTTEIDGTAPAFDSANTGDTEASSSSARTNVTLSFIEADSGIDSATVDAGDFDVAGGATVDSTAVSGDPANIITLTLVSDLATDATPDVTLKSGESISDNAGNTLSGAVTKEASDGLIPVMESAETKAIDEIDVTFSEDLDDGTVAGSDFSSSDGTVDTASVVDNVVTLSLSADMADTGSTPTITLDSSVDDLNANSSSTGVTVTASDGIDPQVSNVTYDNTSPKEKQITITFSEQIALIGSTSDYGVTYDDDDDLATGTQRSVNPQSVENPGGDSTVEMTIPNQSYMDDPGGTFNVEVTGTANVKDVAGNTVNTDNVSAWTGTVSDFNDGGPEIDSAETTSTTKIKVNFNEDLDASTVVKGNFAQPSNVTDATETSAGVVELTLDPAIGSGATPTIQPKTALKDVSGSTHDASSFGGTTDGVSPTILGASTGDNFETANTARTKVVVEFSEDLLNSSVTADKFANVNGIAVTDASDSSGTVTLTLASELATDAAPSVNLSGTVKDASTNENTLTDPAAVDAGDYLKPVLTDVSWSDVDGNGEVDAMDTMDLTFSEAMDTSKFELAPIAGSGAETSWDTNKVTVTLASGEAISIGSSLNPTDTMKDASDNSNDAASTAVTVPAVASTVTLWDGEGTKPAAQYESIQNAINDATNTKNTINVGAGTYNENVDIPEGEDGLELIGAGKDNTIISVSSGNGIVTGSRVTIQGFHIKGDFNNAGRGILADAASSGTEQNPGVIKENKIEGFVGDNKTAIVPRSDWWEIRDNEFVNCNLGVLLAENGPENILITGNTFTNYYDGISATGATTKDITITNNNRFLGNNASCHSVIEDKCKGVGPYAPAGLLLGHTVDSLTFTLNTVTNNASGIVLVGTDFSGLDTKPTIAHNKITTPFGVVFLGGSPSSEVLDASCNYWGNASGPYNATGNPSGTGAEVDDGITFSPWLNAEYPDGILVATTTVSYTPSSAGWHMISVDAEPHYPTPSVLFGGYSGAMFYWDGTDYNQADNMGDIDPKKGYWFDASSDEVGNPGTDIVVDSKNAASEVKSDVTIKLDQANTWYMISAPFDVSWGNARVSNDSDVEQGNWKTVKKAQGQYMWMSKTLYTYDTDNDTYTEADAPSGMVYAQKGYWIETGDSANFPADGLTLKLPLSAPPEPGEDAASMSLAAAGFEPVPEGEETPPAPPAVDLEAGELKATAAVTSDGVTFGVYGADVNAINVQVFSTNGEEIFAESANGNSLSWNANVANGLYLYGVSAKVNGEVKPLGIQKLLILK